MIGYVPKRTDANQQAVMTLLRRMGFSVRSLHETGQGMFDLIVAKHGLNVLVEVKDGEKPRSARELTPAQKQFNFEWTGLRCVVINDDDCLRLNEDVNAIIKKFSESETILLVGGNEDAQYRPSLY